MDIFLDEVAKVIYHMDVSIITHRNMSIITTSVIINLKPMQSTITVHDNQQLQQKLQQEEYEEIEFSVM